MLRHFTRSDFQPQFAFYLGQTLCSRFFKNAAIETTGDILGEICKVLRALFAIFIDSFCGTFTVLVNRPRTFLNFSGGELVSSKAQARENNDNYSPHEVGHGTGWPRTARKRGFLLAWGALKGIGVAHNKTSIPWCQLRKSFLTTLARNRPKPTARARF